MHLSARPLKKEAFVSRFARTLGLTEEEMMRLAMAQAYGRRTDASGPESIAS